MLGLECLYNVTYIFQYIVHVLEQEAGVVNTFHPGIGTQHEPDVLLWDYTDLGVMLEELNHPKMLGQMLGNILTT